MDANALTKYQIQNFARRLIAAVDAERGAEPVSYEYQDRDGNWKPFIDRNHYVNTRKDGTWPIRELYLHPAPATPEGWQLVPKEPTTTMWLAGQNAAIYDDAGEQMIMSGKQVSDIYKTMLAAAPQPGEKK